MGRLLLVALLAAGCALVGAGPSDSPLVTIETRGGRCVEGLCETIVMIERDGRLHRTKPFAGDMADLAPHVVAAIDGAIIATDFAGLRSRPFTGECPTAVDGQEVIYTFATPTGPQRISSCEVDIDLDHPLFVAVQAALGATPP